MKKILVPTDFSGCATAASDLAMDLGEQFHAEVHFYTRIHVHPLWDQLPERSVSDFPESYSRISEAKKQFVKLRKRYADRENPFFTSYSHGNLIRVISRYIDQEHMDLIVMGSHGQQAQEDFLFGSNVQKVVKHASCPVMVVKQPTTLRNCEHVVFASDFRPEALKAFRLLLAFVSSWNVHVHLVPLPVPQTFTHIRPHDELEAIDEFTRLCWRHPCTIHDRLDGDLESNIQAFAQACEADLVALAHYGRPALRQLFTSSVTETLVNQLEVPVMVINSGQPDSWYQLDELEAE